MWLPRFVLILVLALLVTSPGKCLAQDRDLDLQSLQADVLETIDRVRLTVVRVSGGGTAFSGVIVSPEGHVLSAAHAVKPGVDYRITLPDGRRFRGVGKGTNDQTDAGLVKITNPGNNLPYSPMGDSGSLADNQPALGLSYPAGQKTGADPVVRFGRIVRSPDNRSRGNRSRGNRSRGNGRFLQSSVLMEPGDSGGPLFDLDGCVIGIHSRIGQSMDRNYEVPINIYRAHWNELNRERTFTKTGPQTPSLGLRIEVPNDSDNAGKTKTDSDDINQLEGLAVLAVMTDGLADVAGVRRGDRIVYFYDREIQTIVDLREALETARQADEKMVKIRLVRQTEKESRQFFVDLAQDTAPNVPLPEGDHPMNPAARGFRELDRFAEQFADLENRLDDACVKISSDTGDGASLSITGTRVIGTQWILSKNSVIGQDPMIEGEEGRDAVPLKIVQRDVANDLILLRAPQINNAGIDFRTARNSVSVGTFLLTPDDDGPGFVSVVGTPSFRSRKQTSRGFLDVVPETYRRNQGAYMQTINEGGAAYRAGLMVGDVITKMNDILIYSHFDLRKFLSDVDPNAMITATVRRDEDEITKRITLGAFPSGSNHAADKMDKSGRRDGFQQVFSHDADLDPEDCGGPLFDLDGNFVGLNAARNSRVRSFALPAKMLKQLIDQAVPLASP